MLEMLPWRQDAEPSPQSTWDGANGKCFRPPCRFNFDEGTPPTNFDTFPAAIMTVFQVRSSPGPMGGRTPLSVKDESTRSVYEGLP